MARRRQSLDPQLKVFEKCELITDGVSIPSNYRDKVINLVEKVQMSIAARNPRIKFKLKLEDFEFGGKLGSGKFSTVFLVRDKSTDFILALKSVDKELISNAEMETDFHREILIHSKLRHTNIVKCFTLFDDPVNWYLLMEYLPCGNLSAFRQSQKDGRVKDVVVVKYTYQLADALNYMHSLKIVHRDIKPENVLLDVFGNAKLSNFGRAACCPCSLSQLCETSSYIAPEIIERKEYNERVDIWSLGTLIYELLCGEIPFLSKDIKFMLKKIQKGTINFPACIDKSTAELISQLLKYDPKERISASEILIHPKVCS